MKIYKLGEFAKAINVHPKTLITWDNRGVLKSNRTTTNRRYYTEEQLLDYLQIKPKPIDKKNVIYSRVSTRNQKDDLKNQVTYLKEYCRSNGIVIDDSVEDVGSGLNYNRKGFNQLLKYVEKMEVGKIIVTHKDRFVRFGFDWFFNFCKDHECEIVVLDNSEKDIHTELVDDLISIIHVFSCRLYGLRNYKRKTKLDKLVEGEINASKS